MKTLEGKKILILDDEEDLCDLLREEFELAGASVVVCQTLNDAKKSIVANEFDAALSDINLPDGDGLTLISHFRDLGKKANIYFFSGKADLSSEQAMAAGALGVFQKPCKIQTIIEAIALSFLPPAERIRKGRVSLPPKVVPVEVQLDGFEKKDLAKVINIGKGGMFISVDSRLPYVGQPLSFSIHLPRPNDAETILNGKGVCRWVRGQPVQEKPRGFGMEFSELSEEFQKFIDSFIQELQRDREPIED